MAKVAYSNTNNTHSVSEFSVKASMYNATDWYILAAQLGDPWAQFELGLIYKQSNMRNINKAEFWLRKAASCKDKKISRCAERELENLQAELAF